VLLAAFVKELVYKQKSQTGELWQQIVVFTDCMGGNDEIIRKATNSLLGHTELCIQSSSCYFEQ